MMRMRRITEAGQRYAERRRREDEAPRLLERVPQLASLKLEIEERHGSTCASVPKHVRHIVVDNAPALFVIPCGDASCRDGGHDVTSALLRHLAAGEPHFEVDDDCNGSVGSAQCGSRMHLVATAVYR